jgi:hypothetical protein
VRLRLFCIYTLGLGTSTATFRLETDREEMAEEDEDVEDFGRW